MATRKKRTKKKSARKKTKRAPASKMDLSSLTYDQLKTVAAEAAKRAGRLREERIAELREKWVLEAEELGFPFQEVAGYGGRRRRKKKAVGKRATKKAAGTKRTAKKRRQRKAKYVNPADPSQTWAGRGRRPEWLRKYLEGGGSLEKL